MKENNLFIKAKEDLAAAKNLVKMNDFSEEIVLFHCQQAVEKALKSFLETQNTIYPKTHDLEVLLSMCIGKDKSFNQLSNITSLTTYAIGTRYDEVVTMPLSEVKENILLAEKALDFILNKTA